ncbi:hyaluronoglucosaminidase [Streptomyces sp. 1114.5]|uniref:beta-N-acetylglucosaminidase domain-containing protein n=1 Tax=Streptomyces sp. 1114.5 TaxID=1938830 RepID=UPI000F0F3414|nr:beta-N-acetylglucosaminidase domain-containing protein [Streptomyces sp. 1114.5]RKT11010.1 hyaluronoglucosaminidase [Streptomyces sp. 1114.5]
MQARVSVVAGRRLRSQLEQSAALREVLQHPAALAARRATARTCRQLAPRAADRLIADLKGTEPLLASVRAERAERAAGRPGLRAMQIAAGVAAAAVVGGLLAGPLPTAYAAEPGSDVVSTAPQTPLGSVTDPQVFPRPQEQTVAGRAVTVPAAVTLVAAPKADPGAVLAVREVLKVAGTTEVTPKPDGGTPAAGSLVVYVGGPAEGADGEVDRVLRQLAAAAGTKDGTGPSTAGMPVGGYVLSAGQLPAQGGGTYGAVVLSGVDATGTFYAAQSLRQLLAAVPAGQGQAPGAAGLGLPGITLRDWPTGAPVRGTAEAFYGTPWTAQQRLEQVDFLGRSKQNFYLYAPGDDPFRLSGWRTPYPAAQAGELRELGDRARRNHVTLGYAIDPGQSLCFSSAKDVDALVAKLDGLRQLGFTAFQLQFLDVSYDEWHCDDDRDEYGTGPAAAAKAQAELVKKVQDRLIAKNPGLAPLSVVPTEYHQQGATPYRKALAAALPDGVQVAWSGVGVIPEKITAAQTADTAGLYGHPLVTMDNYPVNDASPDRLFLGAYTGREPGVATRSAVMLTGAMQQPVASRIAIATAGDFAWNPTAYKPDESWQAAVRSLAGPTGAAATPAGSTLPAVTALAGNSTSSPLSKQESGYLTPLLDRFWAAAEPTSGVAPDLGRLIEAATPLRQAFASMATAQQTLAGTPATAQLAGEAAPWLGPLRDYGLAGQAALDMLLAQHGGDGTAAWKARVELNRLREQLDRAPASIGPGVLGPFLERAVRAADNWAGVGGGGVAPTTTMGTAHDHLPALMADGLADTFYWSSAPPQPGDAVGLDLGAGRPVGNVTVLMGGWGDGPDAQTAVDDYIRDGVLEYSTGEGGWKQLAVVRNQKTISAQLPPGTVVRAVRLRATAAQKTAVAVREFTVTAPDEAPASVSGGPDALPGSSAAAVLDGNPDTAYRAAKAPTAQDAPLTVELGAARPLDRLTVLTDPGVRATATLAVRRADGTWADIGTIQPGYNELPAGGQVADAFRLTWKPGGDPPVVNQVIPWYADAPAARLSLSDPALDVVTGAAAPVQTRATVEAGRPEGTTGELRADVPATAKGLTVAPAGPVTVPRGGRVGVPLLVSAAPGTPSGTYQVPVQFVAGTTTVKQVLQVHVVPPTGGADLALGAKATSSGDETANFPASAVTDGDPKTRWSSPAKDDAWVRLELPQATRLGAAVLHWQAAYAASYRIQVSADGNSWTDAATVDNGKGGDEAVRFDAPGVRFVRVQGVARATKYGYSLWGVELYAVTPPAQPQPPAGQPPAQPGGAPGATAAPTAPPATAPKQ